MLKKLALVSVIPQILVCIGSIAAAKILGFSQFIIIGALFYLALSYALKFSLSRHHRKGVRILRAKRYRDAIPWFRKSFQFFEDYPWIDHFRYFTLLSSSKVSYREMALLNEAFCYSQIGEGDAAQAKYERTLRLFPTSGIAEAALNMLNSARNTDISPSNLAAPDGREDPSGHNKAE